MKPSVLIVGASRGIGLGFACAYAADGWEVHATTRNIAKPGKLGEVPGDVTLYELDVVNGAQIDAIAQAFSNRGLDVLIHNAGIRGDDMRRAEVMRVNAEAPFEVVGALLPAVERGGMKKIAILTSQLGARHGGRPPSGIYGASKCALNDRFREIEPEWRAKGVAAVVFHPGWVKTDMGGSSAPISVRDSVAGMRREIEQLNPEKSGSFLTWKGVVHPW
jgi:NAD(P)-dependent dehydrogenase (short-subunit alcohol dehydrogenase family)